MVIPISKLQKDRVDMVTSDREFLETQIDAAITEAGSNYSKWPISCVVSPHLVDLAKTLIQVYNDNGWQTRVEYIHERIDHWVEFQLFPQGYDMPDSQNGKDRKAATKRPLGIMKKLDPKPRELF